ncbi:SRPBCC domain-containing protein [Bacillus salitolerans]|uniref:SRPBCC domain-containing protein n=1 Tax=Bacillus salitolerans TaxID=1437434 RepID=A0ABW4LUF4_9BACI
MKSLSFLINRMDKPAIKHSTYIKVKPELIFNTLVTANEWNTWFTDQTTIQINEDGTGEILFKWFVGERTIVDGGKIIKVVPSKVFAFQWSPGQELTTVHFDLVPYKDGTLVTLTEVGYSMVGQDLKACIGCAVGWGEAMTLLKFYLEYGIVCKNELILE